MPNLMQQLALKKKYSELDFNEYFLLDYYKRAAKSANDISKGFDLSSELILEHFNLSNEKPELIKYFESNPTEEVALLFVDITDFSSKTGDKSNKFINSYLDNFYKKAIPIIYSHEGRIEKLMGDGIICVFGKPFISGSIIEHTIRAELCAKDLIKSFKGTNKEVKVALHSGEIAYYKTPGIDYQEYTMIGRTLTELFRLESVSKGNAVNYYDNGTYYDLRLINMAGIDEDEIISNSFSVNLPGVQHKTVNYIKFVE